MEYESQGRHKLELVLTKFIKTCQVVPEGTKIGIGNYNVDQIVVS
jgi:hypothetical protein